LLSILCDKGQFLNINITNRLIDWAEQGRLPDSLLRFGVRRLLRKRIAKENRGSQSANETRAAELAAKFSVGPIAEQTEKANQQHYEVPAALYDLMLGPKRKYSACFWDAKTTTLAQAETKALETTCQRAGLSDGQSILELGCGWGSLTLFMAERFPASFITAVSNSNSQRAYINRLAAERGLKNVEVITCDMNDFSTDQRFDSIVSVEMFEHMKNYRLLLNRISQWLNYQGRLFVHIFCHRNLTYEFQDEGTTDWMSRYFFSGGVMPGQNFLARFGNDLRIQEHWTWNGKHYQATCEAWLKNMDENRDAILPVLEATYGTDDAVVWFNRWRMFHIACSELFGFEDGEEWFVSHYLFSKTGNA
jgi:cyclopropane-fatty-acyl-phospholipid synthase